MRIKPLIQEADGLQRILSSIIDKSRKISDGVKDAIIIADNDVNITYWNKEAENIFQYTEAEVSANQLNKYNVSPPIYTYVITCWQVL